MLHLYVFKICLNRVLRLLATVVLLRRLLLCVFRIIMIPLLNIKPMQFNSTRRWVPCSYIYFTPHTNAPQHQMVEAVHAQAPHPTIAEGTPHPTWRSQ